MQDRIEQVAKEELARAKEARRAAQEVPEQPPAPQASDYYQMQTNAAYEASKHPTAYGSPAEMKQVVKELVDNTSEKYYNAYKHQYDHLVDANDMNSAKQMANEYMMYHALPVIASLVETYGADAVINSPDTLEQLDSIMLTGNGAGDGYTKAYIKQMYSQNLGTNKSTSDIEVIRGLQRATGIANQGDIRSAVGMAKALKEKIDRGELSASSEDYSKLIQATELR